MSEGPVDLLALGASTGGIHALTELLPGIAARRSERRSW